eukprot:CAMPEP_0195024416 /NCGR_PEP_ID=MMETSP0326_2-20130528/45278_1 /TAXON_ID=2866 ORGANISM="Crypthecodinium cohnii, Strain Seligo" /NCGR_SAMPLE_ID=MMETSP0326_2 /ASSEMBLY_ACC=CAM_ASM_000348 /LENGTH=47 /DNA_ID=CAMNT_0040045253 /DNA_START=316 /DNA_END=459 /DNA_ORIENTATION=+
MSWFVAVSQIPSHPNTMNSSSAVSGMVRTSGNAVNTCSAGGMSAGIL